MLKAIGEYQVKILVRKKRFKQHSIYIWVTFMRSGTQWRGRKLRTFDGWDNNCKERSAIIDGMKSLMI
jgi:hypothetical protein